MYQITDQIFVSNHFDTRNDYALKRRKIGAMLQLAIHSPHEEIPTLYHPITDGIALTCVQIEVGLGFVCKHQAQGRRVLIACRAGVCRSVAFAIGALMAIDGCKIGEAYRIVKSQHRDARPFYLPLASIAAYFGQPFTEAEYNALKSEFGCRSDVSE